MKKNEIAPGDLTIFKIMGLLGMKRFDLRIASMTEFGDGYLVLLGPMIEDGNVTALALYQSVFNSGAQMLFQKRLPTMIVGLGKWCFKPLFLYARLGIWNIDFAEQKVIERIEKVKITDQGLDLLGTTGKRNVTLHLCKDENEGFVYLFRPGDLRKEDIPNVKEEVKQLRGYWTGDFFFKEENEQEKKFLNN